MDFLEDQSHVVSFMYELPTRSNRALLEYTVFSAKNMDPENLSPLLKEAICNRLPGVNYRIVRSEKGVIPMGVADPFKGGKQRRLRAGLMAGAARPSTGYAFLRIQRWARDCAESLILQREIQTSHKDPLLTSVMDKIFLRVLKMMPSQTSRLFLDLFKKTPGRSLVRFLNDEGGLLDHIYVINSLPKRPFIRAFIRAFIRRYDA